MTFIADLSKDAHRYLQLQLPQKRPSILRLVRVWCVSRGLWVLATHRLAHYYAGFHPSNWSMRAYKLCLGILLHVGVYLSKVLVKCELRPSTKMAPGIFLSNRGHIVLGARSIGADTIIHERVTIGMNLADRQVPEIGRNVWIGPDCVIYGNLFVGDGATILPGTVLTKSIPPGSVVRGNPARIVRRKFDNSDLRNSLATESAFLGGGPCGSRTDDI